MVRQLQPGIIIDNRLDLNDYDDGFDFVTPEQYKAAEWPEVNGKRVAWETCQTFSGSWGYYRDETSWKSTAQLLELLIESVSKGGNLLLNVGPTGRGVFDQRAQDRLKSMGAWMKFNKQINLWVYPGTKRVCGPAEYLTYL
jgi:alpha-L-fucosidase